MSKDRNIRQFIRSIPTAASPDAQWGLGGVVVGFLVPPPHVYASDASQDNAFP